MSRSLLALVLTAALALAGPALAAELAYSFRTDEGGGVAIMTVDESSGAVTSHEVLFEDGRCGLAKKVRYSEDGSRVLLTTESETAPYAFIARSSTPAIPRVVDLPEPCDEARAAHKDFVVGCAHGKVALVDARTGEVGKVWKGRDELTPPAADPEDLAVAALPAGLQLVVSFQKDSKNGKYGGNRLALLPLPSLKHAEDLKLPRDHPELHVAGSATLQGPCPEVVLPVPAENTLLVTLDLYGAVALMDLDGAMKGRVRGYTVLPTAPDGSWGDSFPDRAAPVPGPGGRPRVVVTNAGRCGGTVLVDPATRTLAGTWATPPGLEVPEWVGPLDAAVAVCTGKTKFRSGTEIAKEFHPRSELYLLPVGPRSPRNAPLRSVDLGAPTRAALAVRPATCRFVAVALEADGGDRVVVVDGLTGTVAADLVAAGQVQRFERRP